MMLFLCYTSAYSLVMVFSYHESLAAEAASCSSERLILLLSIYSSYCSSALVAE